MAISVMVLLENPFSTHYSLDPRISRDCFSERAGHGLKRGFENVVRVTASHQVDMQIATQRFGKRAPEMFRQLNREISDPLPSRLHLVDQIETSREINDRARKGLVHGNYCGPIASYTGFIAQSLRKRLTQANSDVFDRMMVVDVKVAFTTNLQIEQSVAGKKFEHVIKKRNICIDLRAALSFKRKSDLYVCLFRLAAEVTPALAV